MKIDNKFFDLISYFISFFLSIFRSFFVLIWYKKSVKKSYFLKSMDFVFRLWPAYFWKKPNPFKITGFLWMFLKYVFYSNKK